MLRKQFTPPPSHPNRTEERVLIKQPPYPWCPIYCQDCKQNNNWLRAKYWVFGKYLCEGCSK